MDNTESLFDIALDCKDKEWLKQLSDIKSIDDLDEKYNFSFMQKVHKIIEFKPGETYDFKVTNAFYETVLIQYIDIINNIKQVVIKKILDNNNVIIVSDTNYKFECPITCLQPSNTSIYYLLYEYIMNNKTKFKDIIKTIENKDLVYIDIIKCNDVYYKAYLNKDGYITYTKIKIKLMKK